MYNINKKTKLERTNTIPKPVIEALIMCNMDIYPNVQFIFKILCTPERMFSSLKTTKTYLQNSMPEVNI